MLRWPRTGRDNDPFVRVHSCAGLGMSLNADSHPGMHA